MKDDALSSRVARRQRTATAWTQNVERLCGTELAPLGESGSTVQREIFTTIEMVLLIEKIVCGMNELPRISEEFSSALPDMSQA